MRRPSSRGIAAATVAIGALLAASACTGNTGSNATASDRQIATDPGTQSSEASREAKQAGLKPMPANAVDKAMMIAGTNPDEAARESREAATAEGQYAQARIAPGIVAPGAYGAAVQQIKALPVVGGAWNDVTKVPYNSDDARYRDYYSNSSGGLGYVSGRVTGLAADNNSHVYAASADGGVWRSSTGGGNWVSISDRLSSLSSGDLTLAGDGSLWYATGEANTGGTSYVGSGVYRLGDPTTGQFTQSDRVGGPELESTTIMKIRSEGGNRVWAATNRGVWWHAADTSSGAWHFAFAPNMAYMPQIKDASGTVLVPKGSLWDGNTSSGPTDAAYKNIVNDIAVDPTDPTHVVAAIGWRGGDTYNGFYESTDAGVTWRKINPTGALPGDDIGYATFAFAGDGSKLYVVNESPRLYNKPRGTVNSYLGGVYVSNSGSPVGPWSRIATSRKLANSGSALKQSLIGTGYGPGIQAWYNQFLQVDPNKPDNVYLGLEEVYQTTNAGATWHTVGPYWNFYFPCWSVFDSQNTCPDTTHPDQHSAAVGVVNGKTTFFAGNDGGVYSRPVDGKMNSAGHATDWKSLTRDGSMDGLQYYSVAWGTDTANGGLVISGGLQDNGVSNLFGVRSNGSNTDTEMGSNFGGDGGDGMANPANGCQQVQEYVYLSMKVTSNCAQNPGSLTLNDASSKSIDPGDPNPRFIAPFAYDQTNPDHWIAGGQDVWTQDNGWAITRGSQWAKAYDLGSGHSSTAVARSGDVSYAAWCGPCNNNGFTRGIATDASGTWQQLSLPGNVPNRYISSVVIDPSDGQHAYIAINGFSRRFTEGPGAGVGHVYETTDGGQTWTDDSANLPDVPADSIKIAPDGALVLGSDLGVYYRPADATSWSRLGLGLPLVTTMDLELASDGNVYVATHGRGIWSVPLPQ